MHDIRKDSLTGDWVIIAENRADRPVEYQPLYQRKSVAPCPFCLGNEQQTPAAIKAYHNGRKEPWLVRVVPNKYPALYAGETNGAANAQHELFPSTPAIGHHEVIIESPRHVTSLSELTDEELSCTMQAYMDAVARCRCDQNIRSATIFKNCRFEAGASIEHAHSQFISLPVVTAQIQHRIDACRTYFEQTGKLLQQDMLEFELRQQSRIVHTQGNFVVYCPYASRAPFQICVTYRGWPSEFESMDEPQANELAWLLRKAVKALETALHEPAYNLIIQLAPFSLEHNNFYHWYVEIFPRVTRAAGLEWGTECWINPIPPESAAQRLRALDW